MARPKGWLTSTENIAIDLVFDVLGEERLNRTSKEYMDIAARLPVLKELHYQINERLSQWHKEGRRLYEICRFKAGDKRIVYEPFPKTISQETLRRALIQAGFREPKTGLRQPKNLAA
ncbi:MAG: hypothetical protein J0H89_12455 [Rhizobiales bacterium]|jgi:hypothetical protein|nr:hypothetical protein [Hyphomicrobiales bacterium]